MTYSRRRIATVLMAVLGSFTLFLTGSAQAQSLSLWNGESGGKNTFHYGSAVQSGAYEGSWSFEGKPDKWHETGIGLNNLPVWRADLSGYDEIRFFARADAEGKTFEFSVYGWPNRSQKVNIDPYVVGGGGLTTSYKEVRIPTSALKTPGYDLSKVEILYFGTAQPTSGHKIYIDNVAAVEGGGTTDPVDETPLAPAISVSTTSIDFGSLLVGALETQTLSISNTGNALLNVASLTVSGAGFSVSPASMTVAAGGSETVTVTFVPPVAGTASGTLTVVSDDPNQGTVSVALSGSATEPVSDGGETPPAGGGGVTASLPLWSGDAGDASAPKYYYGSAVQANAYEGSWSFEGKPTKWHETGIGLNNLPVWRADLSGYDEIRFFARADAEGKTFEFSIYGWPNRSQKVNIDPYIVGGGGLTTSYKEVRIPMDALKSPAYDLSTVEILYFGKAEPTSGHKIYIDNVAAVKGGGVVAPGDETPTAPAISVSTTSIDFGSLLVGDTGTQTLSISNTGNAALNVSNLTVSGAGFSVSPASMTVAAGGSETVTVTFVPPVAGTASGTLTVVSDDPNQGTVSVALTGSATEPVSDGGETPPADGGSVTASLALWSGDAGDASAPNYYYGSAVQSNAYEGSWSFEGQPTKWHETGIGLNSLPVWRADLSGYDEIRFFARADAEGKTFEFSIYGWPNRSQKVNIDPYVVGGGGLTTSYKEVRIPTSALKTSEYDLSKVEILYFGTAQPTSGHKLYIDNVAAVKGGGTDGGGGTDDGNTDDGGTPVVQTPDIDLSATSLDFGSVRMGQTDSRTLTVSNTGDADLSVTGVTVSGAGFSASPATLNIPAGGSETVTVQFTPDADGSASGSLSIASNDPDENPVTVSLSGSGAQPAPGTPGEVAVSGITSSGFDIVWGPVTDATEVRIYLAAEPAESEGGALPGQALQATLPGTAASYRLNGIAAAVDAFVRVEISSPQGLVSGNVHVRTAGGPRAELDTPLRAVHGYAPNVLQVVLANKGTRFNGSSLNGNTGSSWQAGPWTVTRRDGSQIRVTGVHRHTVPAGQPAYDVGYGLPYDDNVVDLNHRIYLVLDQPVGSSDVLRIQGPSGLEFTLPFSDRYLETPVIQLNQVGYHPQATRRWAYVSGWMGSGGGLSLGNFPATADVLVESADPLAPRTVATSDLALAARSSSDGDAGTEVRQIDLASVPAAEGVRYRVYLPGVGVSWSTAVSKSAAHEAYATVVRGLFHNRWGGDLRAPFTEWTRPVDHPTVYTSEMADPTKFFSQSTPKTGEFPLAGGYHDAGDFDQRPMHVAVAQLLLRAFELNPSGFPDAELNIPESGNGIPDLLDEALWGIAAWEQLQVSNGGVRSGVESYRHPWGYYYADQDPLVYWTYAPEANHTARVAGLFAQASRLVAPYDAQHAEALKNRAINAYGYARSNGAAKTNLLYSAGELFKLTGEASYKADFEAAWSGIGPYGAFSSFAINQFYMGDYFKNNRAMPDFILAYLNSGEADANILSSSESWMSNYASGAVGRVLNSANAHRSPRPSGSSLDWGNGVTTGKYMDTVYGRLQMGGLSAGQVQDYFDALCLAADYVLGGNPDGMVYFTGLGARRVEEPLHLDALAFIKEGKGPIPGIPVYGPVNGLPGASYYNPGKAAFYPSIGSLPPMRRYGDLRTFVMNTEFTVWESQAPHAELFAVIRGLGESLQSGAAAKPALASAQEEETEPEKETDGPAFDLGQNHPNPFNPSTVIRYTLSEAADVKLTIYNVLGQEVRVLVRSAQAPGAHSVQWNGRNASGRKVASGVYFYRLEAGMNVAVRRMIFAK